jgi:hypothetical protein
MIFDTVIISAPKMETSIKVTSANKPTIEFYSTPGLAEHLKTFGEVSSWLHANEYIIFVDARYNFDEVLAYINKLSERYAK